MTETNSTFKLMKIDLPWFICNEREVKTGITTSSLFAKNKARKSCRSQFHDDDYLKFYTVIVSNSSNINLLGLFQL